MAQPPSAACATETARIDFTFEGASLSSCVIEGESAFSVLVTPEHSPPINPSPWYAFRYQAKGDILVHLRYLGAKHRYVPHWTDGTRAQQLNAEVSADGTVATLHLPAGQATVSAQEILASDHYGALLTRLAANPETQRLTLGQSHDGRVIEAVRFGRADAPGLVILLGRQHPPEVTGAVAMDAFLVALAKRMNGNPALARRFQVLAVPFLNPDGVARGHWRANHGGRDLNRDWGDFSQPETRAVADWIAGLPASVRPVAMVDFHSTRRNLFYVQGESETDEAQERFLQAWLGGQEQAIPGYPFTIERRNANPNSGTSKNWFHAQYAIPAYTYEVADTTDRAATASAADVLAGRFLDALNEVAP